MIREETGVEVNDKDLFVVHKIYHSYRVLAEGFGFTSMLTLKSDTVNYFYEVRIIDYNILSD